MQHAWREAGAKAFNQVITHTVESAAPPDDMGKVGSFLAAVVAPRVVGIATPFCVLLVPSRPLLHHFDNTVFLLGDGLGRGICGTLVNVMKSLACLPSVCASSGSG